MSEQQLTDCTYRAGNNRDGIIRDGCKGGWMNDAYDYLKSSIGSIKDVNYPVNIKNNKRKCFFFLNFLKWILILNIKLNKKYVSGGTNTWGSSCRSNSFASGSSAVGFGVTGFVRTPDGSEAWLQNAVATIGPVAVAIAVRDTFVSYSSGVYYDANCDPKGINHIVAVVGYGTDARFGDFWLVRNSWSAGWGEQGNIRMARNKGNLCGIGLFAMYPTGL